jgi:hypothetical protein
MYLNQLILLIRGIKMKYQMLRNNNVVDASSSRAVSLPKFKFKKPADDIDKAIQAFLTGQVGRFGKYVAVPNALIFRNTVTPKNGGDLVVAQNVIALRIDRPDEILFIGNSSILPLVGRTVSFGRESRNSSVTEVQTRLSRYIQMIPFSVFTEAGLNLTNIQILDRGPEKEVTRTETKTVKDKEVKFDVKVHFTGASLFKVDGRTFLFDLDQREIKHKIFNAFLVELTNEVSTVADAYQSLKPQAVVDAEKAGLEVLRQGEWFFIPVAREFTPVKARDNRWDKKQFEPLELRAGNNRPNHAQKYAREDKQNYVTGLVEHQGREHAGLMLKGWYMPVPNTSVQSFTLTGDVD